MQPLNDNSISLVLKKTMMITSFFDTLVELHFKQVFCKVQRLTKDKRVAWNITIIVPDLNATISKQLNVGSVSLGRQYVQNLILEQYPKLEASAANIMQHISKEQCTLVLDDDKCTITDFSGKGTNVIVKSQQRVQLYPGTHYTVCLLPKENVERSTCELVVSYELGSGTVDSDVDEQQIYLDSL